MRLITSPPLYPSFNCECGNCSTANALALLAALDAEYDGARHLGMGRAAALTLKLLELEEYGMRWHPDNSWKCRRRTQYRHREPLHGHSPSERTNEEWLDGEPSPETFEVLFEDIKRDAEREYEELEALAWEYDAAYWADEEKYGEYAEEHAWERFLGRPLRPWSPDMDDEEDDDFGCFYEEDEDVHEDDCACDECALLMYPQYFDDIVPWGRTEERASARAPVDLNGNDVLEDVLDGPRSLGIGRSRGYRKPQPPRVTR